MTCNNKHCKTPESRVTTTEPGYCDKCSYLDKNPAWFKDAVEPRHRCEGGACQGQPCTTDMCHYCTTISDPNFCETCWDDIHYCPHYEGANQ